MKIVIFGADGRTGVELVKYAKSIRHEVTAFVYTENSNKYFPEGVKIVKGDILDYSSVLNALSGNEIAISAIGHVKNSDKRLQTKGIQNIVNAMRELSLTRIISLTGTGVRNIGDKPSFIDIILNVILKIIDPDRIIDGIEHAEVLKNSSLDWTIIRVLKLGDKNYNLNNLNLTDFGPAEICTNRKKLAKIMIDIIDDKNFIKRMPIVSK